MRIKFTIILLILNIIVLFGIKHLKNRSQEGPIQAKSNLLETTISDIDRIEIRGKAFKEERILSRHNNEWKITHPIVWPANLFAVQRIITQLQFLKSEVSFSVAEIEESGQSLADYGLDEPNIELTFHSNGNMQTLAIGKATNLGNRVYVLSPSKKSILVIKEALLDSLGVNLEDLRDHQIFKIPAFELNKLKIQLYTPHNLKIRLSQKNNEWTFQAPIQVNANNARVNDAINQLTAINAKRFIFTKEDKKEAKDALLNPRMRVTLEGSRREQTLLIGGIDKSDDSGKYYYARLENSPTIFTVSSSPFIALKDAQEALRDKRFININPKMVANISISQSNKKIRLQKLENETWKILKQDTNGTLSTNPADKKVLEQLIGRLHKLEAVSFVSDAPSSADLEQFGFNDPQRIVHIKDHRDITLIIGNVNTKNGHLYAKLNNSPFVYEILPNILSLLPVSKLHYQRKILTELPHGVIIDSIQLKHLEKNETFFEIALNQEKGTWEESTEGLSEEKHRAVLKMISGLRKFKVKDYLQERFVNNVQLGPETTLPWLFKLEAHIILPGGDHSRTKIVEYYFTKRLSGNLQIGGSPEAQSIFSLTQDWIDSLFVFYEETQILTQK